MPISLEEKKSDATKTKTAEKMDKKVNIYDSQVAAEKMAQHTCLCRKNTLKLR